MDFVNVLTEVRKIVTVVFGVIIAALVVISVVIVSNATKASVFARREEIQIMKYVGATNSFIRIPFFVEGMITGLLAGGVALAITWFGYDSLVGLLTGQVEFLSVIGMGSIIPFRALAWKVALAYLLSGTLFGAFGSMISMRKQFRMFKTMPMHIFCEAIFLSKKKHLSLRFTSALLCMTILDSMGMAARNWRATRSGYSGIGKDAGRITGRTQEQRKEDRREAERTGFFAV